MLVIDCVYKSGVAAPLDCERVIRAWRVIHEFDGHTVKVCIVIFRPKSNYHESTVNSMRPEWS